MKILQSISMTATLFATRCASRPFGRWRQMNDCASSLLSRAASLSFSSSLSPRREMAFVSSPTHLQRQQQSQRHDQSRELSLVSPSPQSQILTNDCCVRQYSIIYASRHQMQTRLRSTRANSNESTTNKNTTITKSIVTNSTIQAADTGEFYANPDLFPNFGSFLSSPVLVDRVERLLSSQNQYTSQFSHSAHSAHSSPRPSAVQAAAYPIISQSDQDVILGAETGSGKTLAYLLPLVEDVLRRKRVWKERQDRLMEEQQQNDGDENGDNLSGGRINAVMDPGYEYARAIILVPNKELAQQAVRMAASICGGLERCVVWGADGFTSKLIDNSLEREDRRKIIPEEEIVRLAILPGGLSSPNDFPPFRFAGGSGGGYNSKQQPPLDLLFATPATLGPFGLSPKHISFFADVRTLVVDEADMLLDGGYIRELNNVLMGFKRADRLLSGGDYGSSFFRRLKREGKIVGKNQRKNAADNTVSEVSEAQDENDDWFDDDDEEEEQGTKEKDSEEKEVDLSKQKEKTQHIFVAATLPDYGKRSVDAYLNRKFPNATSITMAGMHNARHYGLEKESETVWNELDENKERMRRLVDVLRMSADEKGKDGRGLMGEKVMVFLNSVKDVDGATNGLRRAGINAIPYHAKIPLDERIANLDRFRRYRPPSHLATVNDDDDQDNNNEEETSTTNEINQGTVPILVCTDLASRGLDIPHVTAVVQLQFATNVVAHLHRMGRCGRAGKRDGRGIIFYGEKERELVEVVRDAERSMNGEKSGGGEMGRLQLSQDVEEDARLDQFDEEDGEGTDGDDSGDMVEKVGDIGKIRKAFSRKRGFTKKRKKARRLAHEYGDEYVENYRNEHYER